MNVTALIEENVFDICVKCKIKSLIHLSCVYSVYLLTIDLVKKTMITFNLNLTIEQILYWHIFLNNKSEIFTVYLAIDHGYNFVSF